MNNPPRTDASTAPYIDGISDLEPVGRGGFGTVYRGRQVEFNRTVAIKVLTGLGSDPEADRRFRREVAAMGSVSHHPNVVPVYATGVAADGRPYLIMPYLPGGTLAERLGTMSWQAVVDLGSKMSGALQAAHDVGVLHRDVKPANILWSEWDEPQLADFGIAQLHDATRTAPGSVAASLWWAAPEVLEGKPASPASDVYSLAASLHAAITGRSPHSHGRDEPMAATVARIASEIPPDLSPLGVPRAVSHVILGGLAKDPALRPATARAFGDALVGAAVTEPSRDRDPTPVPAVVPLPLIGATPPVGPGATADRPTVAEPQDRAAGEPIGVAPAEHVGVAGGPAVATPSAVVTRPAPAATPWAPIPEVLRRRRRRRRMPALLGAAVVLVAVVALVVLALRLRSDDPTDRASTDRSATTSTTAAASSSTATAPTTAARPSRAPGTTARPTTTAPAPPSTTEAPSTTVAPGAVGPGPSAATPAAGAADAPTALRRYYGLIAQRAYGQTWNLLTPAYQRQTGGFDRYTSFWNRYRTVEVTDVRVDNPLNATATLRYIGTDGTTTTDTSRFRFQRAPSGALLIDDLA